MSLIVEFLLLGLIGAGCVALFLTIRRRMPDNRAYRLAVGLAVAAGFFLFWSNSAVGVIGSSENDANMLYVLMLGLCLVGVLVVRARPRQTSWLMFAVAACQISIPIAAFGFAIDITPGSSVTDVAFITVFFTALWTGSGLLFRKASLRAEPSLRP